MSKNSDICRAFFSSMPDFYFNCKYCGAVRGQKASSGYGNPVSHLNGKRPGYEADYLAQASSMTGNLHSYGFPISSKTVLKYLAATTKAVEKAIAAVIPTDFGAMFDGWACFGEHYVAVIAVFWLNGVVHYTFSRRSSRCASEVQQEQKQIRKVQSVIH
ncbi:hypothetical protein PF005_g5984 [Phytophthora fragariae]|uniref:BED-type domain-containing protein n=1 Tax=Phytophthora fragariae TaxID=53985 RepID=A0A6A3ZX63_9STRA|nr:hypothetical protein PF003_g3363 [Phytophthora fragariae]KAE9127864.1 hypothetical protein PF007_g5460 [Phytophthora fragariae]KAE9224271.1 hypothetical protein PF005_g5984 [Phytophthora fragariae]KAE9246362.1 hypothetical protein PF002_g6777 [Phytophthora fragariae]